MRYVTVTGKNYEDAIKKARSEYGDKLRVQSRKDIVNKGFLGLSNSKVCELTCFITDDYAPEDAKVEETNEEANVEQVNVEETAQVEEPKEPKEAIEEKKIDNKELEIEKAKERGEYLLCRAKELLKLNDFTDTYIEYLLVELKKILEEACPAVPSMDDFEIVLVDKIVGSVLIDHESQQQLPHLSAFVGGTSSGKTTTISKIAGFYSSPVSIEMRKTSSVIVVNANDSSYESIKKVGMALDIPVSEAKDSTDLATQLSISANKDVVLIDTIGSNYNAESLDKDLYKTFYELTENNQPSFFITIPANAKNNDIKAIFKIYKPLKIKGFMVTKLDETTTIGNVISICHDYQLPLSFVTDGKKIPKDLKKASATTLVAKLKGFNIDVKRVVGLNI